MTRPGPTAPKPGDYEARHNEPAWRDRANFVIAADIAGSPDKREWEQLWARKLSDTRFEICCIPFLPTTWLSGTKSKRMGIMFFAES